MARIASEIAGSNVCMRLVVVGERDEHAAVLALGLGDEVGVQARCDDGAVGARLQPVGAHLVERAGLDGRVQGVAVAERPGADEVGTVRPVVVERAGEGEGRDHREQPHDDDHEEGGEAPPPGPARAAAWAAVGGPVGVRGHAAMMTA